MELHYTVHLYGRLATCVLELYTLSYSFLLQTFNITKCIPANLCTVDN